MAGAYTSLLSLTNTIDLIQNHPRHSFSFDDNQIRSLQDAVRLFLEFIESYNSHGRTRSKKVEKLEMEILFAAWFFENTLESLAVDQIRTGSTLARAKDRGKKSPGDSFHNFQKKLKAAKENVTKAQKKIRSIVDSDYRNGEYQWEFLNRQERNFYELEDKISYAIDPIREKIRKLKEETRVNDEQQTDFMAAATAATTSRPPATRETAAAAATVVGFDDYSIQLLDFLTGPQSSREILSVIGMGGSGKTTLAKTVFSHQLITEHFDVRAWATISQEHDLKEILLELLSRKGESTHDTRYQLGEQLHKKLSGQRYLIVLDDMWSGEVWDKIRFYFPDYGNNSRILVTTRLSSVASYFTSSSLKVDLLDEDKSWELFCAKTFEGGDCPPQLVKLGKNIVGKCKGLALSIVVIAGHLRNSMSRGHWVYVANNMASVLSSGDDDGLSILSLSYSHLPPHLKPCFLYMGVYREDEKIPVSTLARFWIAEGFLRPDGAKSLEEIAEDCLNDLAGRNLISIEKGGQNGQISKCNIHDLLREVCLKVGREEKFFCTLKNPKAASRRCSSCEVCNFESWRIGGKSRMRIGGKSRMLRILDSAVKTLSEEKFDPDCLELMFNCFNMRHMSGSLHWDRSFESYKTDREREYSEILSRLPYVSLPSSISLHWNLQTLVLSGFYTRILAPVEIWEMPQLRHVNVSDLIRLPDPPAPRKREDLVIMQNLFTLKVVEDFKLGVEVCRRIPNVKDLEIHYTLEASSSSSSSSEYCQQNLDRFSKLETLRVGFDARKTWGDFARKLAFPGSLKELWLESSGLHWEDLSTIGSLPNLQVLTLCRVNSVRGSEWDTVEGEFRSLKSLTIYECEDLVSWSTDKTHFPVLETLSIGCAYKLAEFPSDVGYIPTLQRIHLDRCNVPAAISAMRMVVEQEEFGNEDLQLEIEFEPKEMKSFKEMAEEEGIESNNVRLKYYSSLNRKK